MAINFTDSPADGATQVVGGRTYTYNSTKNKWDTTATEVTGPTATVYASVDALPTSGNITGAQAYVSGNNRLYIWNGTGWYNIALINTAPSISGVNSSYALALDGTATTVTITATDPEGLPITYSIASDTSGNIATVTQGTGVNVNVFTITPTTNTANAGTFSLTFRASDGVNLATAVSEFTLQFSVENSSYTTALITTNGSTGTNSTFTDSSSSSQSLTVYGNTTQTSFSPYRSGGYSAYFDGSTGTKLTTSSSFDFSGAYTVEYWVNTTDGMNANTVDNSFGDQLYFDLHVNASTGLAIHRSRTGTSTFNNVTGTTDLRDGQWHHIAAVRDGSGNMTLYVDGVSEGTSVTDSTNLGTNQKITIGAFDYENTAYDGWRTGYVRDFRVSSNARYSSNFTAPTEPLTADSNTTLLTCHLPYFADGSTNNHTLTSNGNVSTQPFGPYDYQEYAVGDHGGSTYFDGTGDYIQVGTNVLPAAYDTDWTVEFWMYPNTMADRGDIFSQYSASTVGRMAINTQTDNTIKFFQNGLSPAPLSSAANIYANQWYHVAVVNSSGTRTLYVNGKSQGTATGTSSMDTTNTQIGQTPGQDNFEGNISDLRVVNGTAVYTADFTPPTAPLSAVTNTNLFIKGQDAKIFDKSQSVKRLPLSGNTTASTAQYKYLPTSMAFDGTGDYLYLPDYTPQGTEDFTFEAWIYAETASDSPIWESRPDGSNTTGFTVTAYSSTVIRVWTSAALVSATVSNYLNSWTHVAFTRSGSTNRLFINGNLEATASASDNFTNEDALIGGGRYGAGSTVTNYFDGYISDVRITKGLARYTANFTPPTAALQG